MTSSEPGITPLGRGDGRNHEGTLHPAVLFRRSVAAEQTAGGGMSRVRHNAGRLPCVCKGERQDAAVEIAKLVLEYVKALAWPVFAAVLLWVMRAQLRHAIGRLTRVETPAGSAEFAAAAADVLDDAEELALSTASGPNALSVVPRPAPSSDAAGSGVEPEADSGPDQEPRTDDQASEDRRLRQTVLEGLESMPYRLDAPGFESSVPGKRFRKAMHTASATPRAAVIDAWGALEMCFQEVMWARGIETEGQDAPFVGPTRRRLMAIQALGLSDDAMDVYARLRQLRNRAVHDGEEVTVAAAEDFVRSCRTMAIELQRSG
ncbi:hypothetical protein [Streptomyces sp. NPDC060035]|uniref:hypothetical protein n=1 Tax=Streptomyces sp. NPDC060035 TaxID=3347044 RepID=UPI0036C0FB0F